MHVKSTIIINVVNDERVIKRLCQFYRGKKNQLLQRAAFLLVVKTLKLFITDQLHRVRHTHTHTLERHLVLGKGSGNERSNDRPWGPAAGGLISQWS